ncbi:ankyrin repeat-containing domain protein [Aspergillus parasiticus]|uniref:Ankyrin repeat-containing domain protein n=1 Tax=Aspergillus parasiticus TaxID=5067 RepID=A0A5N6E1Q3_ASPPA|nr:ankyrin repeat-containing domain protein [Aspergillus parasiticus]
MALEPQPPPFSHLPVPPPSYHTRFCYLRSPVSSFTMSSASSSTFHTQGGAIFNGNLTANRDINIHHITTIRPLAHTLHHSLFISSDMFKQVQTELALLLVALDTLKENLESTNSSDTLLSELDKELQNCHWVLLDLEALEEHFESVGPDTQVTWEREGWKIDEVAEIRTRLSSYVGMLNLWSINMIKSSQAHVEQMLKTFIDEVRSGKREASVVSSDSLSITGKEAWRQLRKELEGVGISPNTFAQNRTFIRTTLKRAIEEEGLGGDLRFGIHDMDESNEETGKDGGPPAITATGSTDTNAVSQDKTTNGRPKSVLPSWVRKPTRIANMLYKVIDSGNEFIYCAADGDLNAVKQRLDQGVDVNMKNDAGETALSQAAANGFADVVRFLINQGAHIDLQNRKHETPLVQAAKYGHEEVVRVLLEQQVDVNRINQNDDKDTTALHKAAEHGQDEVVRLLLANGAHIDVKDFWNMTPLHKAAKSDQVKTVQILLNHGANPGDAWRYAGLNSSRVISNWEYSRT